MTVNPDRDFIKKLSGGGNIESIEPKLVDEIVAGPDAEAYVGRYDDLVILVQGDWVVSLIAEDNSELYSRLVEQFPKNDILVICLQSSVNMWGFCLIQNGIRIRAKAVSFNDGVFIDEGQPLPEEEIYLRNSKVDAEGKRLYWFEDLQEYFAEDQIGESIVFDISKRILGHALNSSEDLLDTEVEGFALEDQGLRYMLSGEWRGEYQFGKEYRKQLQGHTEAFTIRFREWVGTVEGECVDDNKKDLAPAKISGSIKDGVLHFVKQYPFSPVLNKNKKLIIDHDKQSPKINYVGGWDRTQGIVFGIWEMERNRSGLLDFGPRKLAGKWRMKKVK